MTFALGPRAAQSGYRILSYDSLDSTSTEAMRLSRAGGPGPLWVAAREQTAGRGRRGRNWVTIPGNLAASLLIRETLGPAEAAKLSFVAALAAWDACDALAPGASLTLKWPNDLLADGRKLGGVLLESETQNGTLAIVIGFGVNLAGSPVGMSFPAISLAELGHAVSAEAAFAALSDAWVAAFGLWRERGFDEIRQRWLQRAEGVGAAASVVAGERVESGIFETLDVDGRMVLRLADGGVRLVSAGDVHFGDAASAGAAS